MMQKFPTCTECMLAVLAQGDCGNPKVSTLPESHESTPSRGLRARGEGRFPAWAAAWRLRERLPAEAPVPIPATRRGRVARI